MAALGELGGSRDPDAAIPSGADQSLGRSRGTLAETNRINAEATARFMTFYPEAGCCLPHEKSYDLKTLTTTRGKFVEIRKCLMQRNKADRKIGMAGYAEDLQRKSRATDPRGS